MKKYKPIINYRKLSNNNGYSVRVKYKEGGNWRYTPWHKVRGNKLEAEQYAIKVYEKLESKSKCHSGTLEELVLDFKEKRQQLGKVSESTIERNKYEYRRIIKYLGDTRLSDLNSNKIENAYVKMAKDGVSKNSIHKTHTTLKKILDIATKDDKIPRNPCLAIEGITAPKVSIKKKNETRFNKDMYFELIKVLKESEITSKTVVVWLAANTGMRRGEILALQWKHVKLTAKIPTIKIQYSYSKEKELKRPKTDSSIRTISIDKATVKYLTEWKAIQKEYFKDIGLKHNQETIVCTNEFGDYLDPNNFSRWRRQFFVENGFAEYDEAIHYRDKSGQYRVQYKGYRGPNLHSLRHTQATLLVGANIDPKTVQGRLGHSRITTTLEIYAEALEENDQVAADCIGDYIDKI